MERFPFLIISPTDMRKGIGRHSYISLVRNGSATRAETKDLKRKEPVGRRIPVAAKPMREQQLETAGEK